MLKKILFVISLLIFSCSLIFSQEVGTWKTYSSKKEIVSVSGMNDNEIWCATTGGAFMYEKTSGSFLQLSSSEGLTNPLLTSISVDDMNQVWFGTYYGSEPGMLNVYNFESGVVSKINDIYNSDFTQKNINEISSFGDTVLVSTAFGLSLLNPENYSFYDTYLKFGDFDATIPVLSAAIFDRFFIITDDGIAVQKSNSTNLTAPEAWDSFPFRTTLNITRAYEFAKYKNSVLVATNRGIYKFSNNNWELYLLENYDVENVYSNGTTLFISTLENNKNIIYSFDGTTLSTIYENNNSYEISDLFAASTGTIYAGTNSGLLKIENGNSDLLVPNGPANNSFLNLATDDDGKLWVATGKDVYGVGVMSFDGENWELLSRNTNSNILSNAFYNVFADGNTKYFCNWGQGLTVLEGDNITNYTAASTGIQGIPNDPNFLVVTDVKTDSKGNIWILNLQSAEAAPLSVITTSGEFYSFQLDNPLITESDLAYNLEIDQYDTKWFTIETGSVGLYYFNENGTFENTNDDVMGRLRSSNGLSSSTVSALALDELGLLWVGTNVGVDIITNPSNPTSYISSVTALSQQTITDIFVDPLNQKWVGTVQGLYHLSADGTVVINSYTSENSPLPSDNITSVTVDGKNGIVYAGTDYGVAALTTSSVAPKENMDDLFVFPNPVVVSENSTPSVTIKGLIRDTSIKILSISGGLVREIETPGGSIAFWDVKNEDGNFVPSGVYLIVAYDEDGTNVAKAKVAVLRK